jgi:hypothetical protein
MRSAYVTRPLSEPLIGGSEWQLVHLAASSDATSQGTLPVAVIDFAPDDEPPPEEEELEPDDEPPPEELEEPEELEDPDDDPPEGEPPLDAEATPDDDEPPLDAAEPCEALPDEAGSLPEELLELSAGAPIGVQVPKSLEFPDPPLHDAIAPMGSTIAISPPNFFMRILPTACS